MEESKSGNGQRVQRPRCGALGAKRLYCFVPQSDITVFELAEAQEMLFFAAGVAMKQAPPAVCDQMWEAMSLGGRRNWKVQEFPKIVTANDMPGFSRGV